MKRKLFSAVITAVIIFSMLPVNIIAAFSDSEIYEMYEDALNENKSSFSDLDSVPWAVLPITELAKKGIVSGMSEGIFAPQKNISRAEYIKLIVSVCGLIDKGSSSSYADVPQQHWSYIYVSSAKALGLIDIYPEDAINPDTPISREDICYISAKALEHCVPDAKDKIHISNSFTDEAEMSQYAISPIYKLTKLSVLSGRGNGLFSPKDQATRAESAKIIYNILKIIEENY